MEECPALEAGGLWVRIPPKVQLLGWRNGKRNRFKPYTSEGSTPSPSTIPYLGSIEEKKRRDATEIGFL